MPRTATNDLLALLEDERKAILAGRIDALPDLTLRKLTSMDALLNVPQDTSAIARIAVMLARNARLLASARDGLAAAHARLAAIKAVRDGLEVYGADGSRTVIARGGDILERKA